MTYMMTEEQMRAFEVNLRMEEHSESTIQKYASAIMTFYTFLPCEKIVTKEQLLAWKNQISATLAASTVNVMISALNSFFAFLSWTDLPADLPRQGAGIDQRGIYASAGRGASEWKSAPVPFDADAWRARHQGVGTQVRYSRIA